MEQTKLPIQNGRNNGFIYIGMLIGLAIIGIGLGLVSEVFQFSRQREREEELQLIGNEFRQAITHYYMASPSSNRTFPILLADLIQDDRLPNKVQRHIRRIYMDPMTGKAEWGELRLNNGQLIGIFSLSGEKPIKVANFSIRNQSLFDKKHYYEWVFKSELLVANDKNPSYQLAPLPVTTPFSKPKSR